jgi:hypothetical protein
MAAKLPAELMTPMPRRLRDVQIGETVYVYGHDMQVDKEGHCYLSPSSQLVARGPFAIEVVQRSDGFHVTVISKETTWMPGTGAFSDWFPVATIAQSLDPEFDLDRWHEEMEARTKRLLK